MKSSTILLLGVSAVVVYYLMTKKTADAISPHMTAPQPVLQPITIATTPPSMTASQPVLQPIITQSLVNPTPQPVLQPIIMQSLVNPSEGPECELTSGINSTGGQEWSVL